MQEYETEDQQIEALKKWWNENATSLFAGLFIGLAGLAGWNYYNTSKSDHLAEASDLYTEMMYSIETGSEEASINAGHDRLIAEYADTPYAVLASLARAGHVYAHGDVEAAKSNLEWVAAHANDEAMVHTARLRLVRLLIEQEKYREAEARLEQAHPEAYIAMYEELKGDLYVAMGDRERAKKAYGEAVRQPVNGGEVLTIKYREVGGDPMARGAS